MESGQGERVYIKKDCLFCESKRVKISEFKNPDKDLYHCPICKDYIIALHNLEHMNKRLKKFTEENKKSISRFICEYNDKNERAHTIEIVYSDELMEKKYQYSLDHILEQDNTTVTAGP